MMVTGSESGRGWQKVSTWYVVPDIWKQRNARPSAVEGVSSRSRNGAPSRKGCVVNGQITKASNKRVRPFLKSQRRHSSMGPPPGNASFNQR